MIKDINILPKQNSIRFSSTNSQVRCLLDLYQHKSNEARILKEGTIFTIRHVDSIFGFYGKIILQYEDKIYDLNCDSF